jgi:homoserine acetyltransferase
VLQSGLTYRGARLAYKTHGTLNAAKSNVIVYPTSYGAQHPDLEWLIAPGKPLDPSKYFIIIVNKFGNGLSSSPSNGVPSMRFETHDSASMLFRHVDIDLAAYPMLAWRWYIELPIRSPLDERTREGDDHPARLFLRFLT